MKLRVLQVINSLKPRGAEAIVTNLSTGLQAAGCDVTVFTLFDEPSWHKDTLTRAGIPHLTSNYSSGYSPLHVRRICDHLAHSQYDIVHAHLFPSQLWVAAAVRRLKYRSSLVTTEHSAWNRRRRIPALSWLDRRTYKAFQAIACISQTVESSVRSWLRTDIPLTRIIPNGTSLNTLGPANKYALFKTDRPVIISAGRLTAAKNQIVLIDAMKHCPGAELFLAGSGPMHRTLEQRAIREGVAERVHLMGERQDVPALVASADLYAQPSLHEGFGLAALEAMAAGLPMVVSDVDGLAELVGNSALKVAPDSAAAFARAFKQILADSVFAKDLATRARRRAQKYSTSRMVDGYLNLYTDLAGLESR